MRCSKTHSSATHEEQNCTMWHNCQVSYILGHKDAKETIFCGWSQNFCHCQKLIFVCVLFFQKFVQSTILEKRTASFGEFIEWGWGHYVSDSCNGFINQSKFWTIDVSSLLCKLQSFKKWPPFLTTGLLFTMHLHFYADEGCMVVVLIFPVPAFVSFWRNLPKWLFLFSEWIPNMELVKTSSQVTATLDVVKNQLHMCWMLNVVWIKSTSQTLKERFLFCSSFYNWDGSETT